MNYIEQLHASAQQSGSVMCMGLDPVLHHLPGDAAATDGERIEHFMESLLTAIKNRSIVPAAFKPNIGYYHCLDRPREGLFQGSQALASVLDMLETLFPGIPVILDFKRGDIARSSANYAWEGFDSWGCQAVTVAPYMGHDSVMPFLEHASEAGGGVYILNRTSNPGAALFQNLMTGMTSGDAPGSPVRGHETRMTSGDAPLFMRVAASILEWTQRYPGTGAVVGATSPEELASTARFFSSDSVPLLIPGVGSQGGSAQETLQVLRASHYPLSLARINSSSGLTHPWATHQRSCPSDWLDQCLAALIALHKETSLS